MNKELIINVTASEITIALFEDKQLVELTKEQSRSGYAVGDIYMGKVKKIMPGLNAAFVNVGHEKDGFIHYLDLGPQFTSLQKMVNILTNNKRSINFEGLKLEKPLGKSGKIASHIASGQTILVQVAKEAISTATWYRSRSPAKFRYRRKSARTKSATGSRRSLRACCRIITA